MEKNFPMANYQFEKINEVLNELKDGQASLSEDSQKNFEIIMSKLMKLQEYNKIADMTNQVFEMRMSNIEDILFKLCSKI